MTEKKIATAHLKKKYPNKTALGSTGRPREHDRDKVAADMIEWSKREDSYHLAKFCATYDPIFPSSKITVWSNESESFRQAYESAKDNIAHRREQMLCEGRLHVKAYDLNASTYDYFLRDDRRKQAEFEHALKLQQEQQVAESVVDAYTKTMTQLKGIQGGNHTPGGALDKAKTKTKRDK